MELNFEELTIGSFLNLLGSDSPAPGGGAVSGLSGALAAACGKMVADLTLTRKKYEQFHDIAKEASDLLAEKIKAFQILAQEDAKAYSRYTSALALPKETDQEKAVRKDALSQAIRFSTEVPCKVIALALETVPVLESLYGRSNQTCMGDLAAAAEELQAACDIAWLNVLANLPYLPDAEEAERIRIDQKLLLTQIRKRCISLYAAVEDDLIASVKR